ncbi:uncharacterized protein KY384_000384 [Bacidia gigantensis]|uniref:uncharacterized protein n=1 Tax=Bacidia gigantensis TaxID=2732470 RepID=UPI001D045853|nr:uncharacterized protein KY384_000384 [Bacidia gigantensis]KAG8526390.1 hypothetical protein KY384_000384 [Bacidia gigantensis]
MTDHACTFSTPHEIHLSRTTAALKTLLKYYDQTTGLFSTTGWWNSANAITVLADFAIISPSLNTILIPLFSNTLTQAPKSPHGFPGFLNDFYDDEGWWALAFLRIYDVTNEDEYLEIAMAIFEDMTTGWGGPCGGVWWNKRKEYTGAVENEVFLATAAGLANRTAKGEKGEEEGGKKRGYYKEWAVKQWKWFQGTGMINAKFNVNNGIDAANCKNDGGQVWTYNQGVILGALVELNVALPDEEYLDTAEKIAMAALEKMTDQEGILHEPNEPDVGADGAQFKGIFTEEGVWRVCGEECRECLAESGEGDDLGVVWSAKTEEATAATQSSACEALVAALAVVAGDGVSVV